MNGTRYVEEGYLRESIQRSMKPGPEKEQALKIVDDAPKDACIFVETPEEITMAIV